MEAKSKQQLKSIAESLVKSKEKLEWCENRFTETGEFNDSRDIVDLKNYIKMLLKNSPWNTIKQAEAYLK